MHARASSRGRRWSCAGLAGALLVIAPLLGLGARTASAEVVRIEATAASTPFPHFWERTFGSGHAILAMRWDYLRDLRAVKRITGFRYVRFHGIFDGRVGVYRRDYLGNPVYNFSNVDTIYDGLLENGVMPFVELSFMPRVIAADPYDRYSFWYRPIVSPPQTYGRWAALIRAFARHLIARYGIEEVSQWYFEVWNEPNETFRGGRTLEQRAYFGLYDATARALKSVNPRLEVGGPATAHAAWIRAFLRHVTARHVPVDFISTHVYADDTSRSLFGGRPRVPYDDRICRAVKRVRGEIDESARPHLPLFITEWSVMGKDDARDTTYVGPAVADTIRQCDGSVQMMSYWTFSDVFEEDGPNRGPFTGGFGLRAYGGINKPAYYDFELLHQLGHARLANAARNVIVTRTRGGGLAIALWNLVDPGARGKPESVDLKISGVPADAAVAIERVDRNHSNVLPVYRAMGSPRYPTPQQVARMNAATALPQPLIEHLHGGTFTVTVRPDALFLVKVGGKRS
ncbi:MAG: GH39 family glycosyl hydrolase [Steroidobacteraceae bacterium]